MLLVYYLFFHLLTYQKKHHISCFYRKGKIRKKDKIEIQRKRKKRFKLKILMKTTTTLKKESSTGIDWACDSPAAHNRVPTQKINTVETPFYVYLNHPGPTCKRMFLNAQKGVGLSQSKSFQTNTGFNIFFREFLTLKFRYITFVNN